MTAGLLDPFEDAVNAERWYGGMECPPDGGFLWRLCQLERVRELQPLPEGYGVAWYRMHDACVIAAPMPWNLLIGALYHASWWMLRPFHLSKSMQMAFSQGVDHERAHGNRRLRELAREHEFKLGEAKYAGRMEMFNELQQRAAEAMRFPYRES